MQSEIFHQILENPHLLKNEQVSEIKHLLNKYPYFQSAYTVLLKNHYSKNHIDFEDLLRLSAVYSMNRGLLRKYLIHNNNTISLPTEIVTSEKEISNSKTKDDLLENLNRQILSEVVNFSLQQEVDEIAYTIPQESLLTTKEAENESKKDFYEWLAKPQEEPKKRLKYEHLIDKFLHDQPKIVPKKEFYSPVNMARKSVEEDENIVSETLANLYLQQGHYSKAIKAFQQLSLKFPKKNSYFAARIVEIEEIKKNKKS